MIFILDLDDTLYLEVDYVRSGFVSVDNWLEKQRGIIGFYDSAWHQFKLGLRGNIFDQVLESFGIRDTSLIPQMISVYREHQPCIDLLPDTKRFFNNYGPEKLGLITDGYSQSQWAKIEALKLRDKIGQIIVTGDWGKEYWKPHTRSFLEIQKNHYPFDCVYIGDNPKKDFIAPSKLRWAPSIRIRREGSLHIDMPTPKNCYEATTLDDVDCFYSNPPQK